MTKGNLKIIYLLIIIFLIPDISFASNQCSKDGYTVLTINGILTNDNGAKQNAYFLAQKLSDHYGSQPLIVDYLLNPSHMGGALDFITAFNQGFFNEKSDYDLTEMLTDASDKITTQKVLLVGHSQGNFYANNFYDTVADKAGGIPSQSLGVFSVATPANHVAGGGKYITSDTDKVINASGAVFSRLPANSHIDFQMSDDIWGHDFTKVYLQYQAPRIVSDIQSSLSKLQANNIQNIYLPCMNPPAVTFAHELQRNLLAFSDHPIDSTFNGINNAGLAIINATTQIAQAAVSSISSLARSLFNSNKSLATNNPAAVILADVQPTNISQNSTPKIIAQNSQPIAQTTAATAEKTLPDQAMPAVEIENTTTENKMVTSETPENLYPNLLPGMGGVPASLLPPDVIPPVITITGSNPISVNTGSSYTDAGATALDDIDGARSVVTSGTVNTGVIGTYTITYTATDLSNNTATATRTVNVVVPPDTTPPVITLIGSATITLNVGGTYTEDGANATDNVDSSVAVVITGTVDTSTAGTYTVRYNAIDAAGNHATEITRTINVTAPSGPYLENSQLSLPVSISSGRFYYCANVSSGFATLLTFGSIFVVSDGGVSLDSIGVRGVAGSGTVTSASLKIYPYTGTVGNFNQALSFGGDSVLPLGSLTATSDIFNPSTWSGADDTGTNPSNFPYYNIIFPHVFLPAGNYFMTFGDCAGGTDNYFGVKGSGNGFSQGFQGLFSFNSLSFGGLHWDNFGGFGFDYVINRSF